MTADDRHYFQHFTKVANISRTPRVAHHAYYGAPTGSYPTDIRWAMASDDSST